MRDGLNQRISHVETNRPHAIRIRLPVRNNPASRSENVVYCFTYGMNADHVVTCAPT